MTKMTRRAMWNKGTIARRIEFKTTWRPDKRKLVESDSFRSIQTHLELQKLIEAVEALETLLAPLHRSLPSLYFEARYLTFYD
jgi:hypothetical protein